MQYTEQDLKHLIDVVTQEFTTHLAKAEEMAEKKDEPKEEQEAKPEHDEKAEEDSEGKSEAKPEHKEEEHKEAAPEHKEDEKHEQEPEHKEEASQDVDACDYDDEDMEHLHKMYSSMKKAELKVHHDAVRSALDKCGDMQMSMDKSEKDTSIEVKAEDIKTSDEVTLLKSEVQAEKEKAASLQKNLDAVQEFLTKFVKASAPKGKAITSLEVVQKSEQEKEVKTFSEGEITSILSKKAASPDLSKSDRESINDYYLNNKNINIISHLLTK